MQYFTVQAKTHSEALNKIKIQYGERGKILTYRNVRMGGFLGLFAREGIEITGYVSDNNKKINIQEEKKKIIQTAAREQALLQILKELKEIKQGVVVKQKLKDKLHPNIEVISENLRLNAFTQDFIDDIIKRMHGEFTLKQLDDYNLLQKKVLEWIGEKIDVFKIENKTRQTPKFFIVIGPTGVGKTTTIAKLAARYKINGQENTENVRILTIDNYRIAARKQIETYAEIMRIPISFAETTQDFKKLIALYSEVNIVFVDTIGRSPKDLDKLAEMKNLLNNCGNTSETHLAISATTKSSDIEEILQQFEPFKYKSVIITKLDETCHIGNIISVLAKKGKPVSFITDGQKVPQDIEEVSVMRLLMALDGFRIEREHLEKIFGKYGEKNG